MIKELWQYRALLAALVERHLHSRYRGSVLGFLWSFLNPLCLMVVYTIVFHYYIRASTEEHYALFLFAGLLPWLWSTSSLHEGTCAIVSGGHLITKSMFPAHVLPVVAVLTNMVNFILSIPLLIIFIIAFHAPMHWTLCLLPVLILMQGSLLYGFTVALSSLNVQYRDVQHVIGNVLNFLFFLCPIVYSPSVIPPHLQWTLIVNPFAALAVCYQDIVLHGVIPGSYYFVSILLWSIFSLLLGSLIYNRYHEGFAELL